LSHNACYYFWNSSSSSYCQPTSFQCDSRLLTVRCVLLQWWCFSVVGELHTTLHVCPPWWINHVVTSSDLVDQELEVLSCSQCCWSQSWLSSVS